MFPHGSYEHFPESCHLRPSCFSISRATRVDSHRYSGYIFSNFTQLLFSFQPPGQPLSNQYVSPPSAQSMVFVFTLMWLGPLYGLALYLFGYAVILTVYRLWFSPLAAFPGPLLARTSFWYEFYYNWIRLGTYYLKVKEMHDMYGKRLLRAFSIPPVSF